MRPLILCLLFVFAVLRTVVSVPVEEDDDARSSDDIFGDVQFKLLYKVFEECSKKGIVPCLKMKALTMVDRALRKTSIQVSENFALIKDTKATEFEESSRAMTESELETSLPVDSEKKEDKLDELLLDRVGKFLKSYTIQIKLFDGSDVAALKRSVSEGKT